MKTFSLLAALLLVFFSSEAKEKQLIITDERVELVITEKTTESLLKKFAKTLKEEANIDFTFKDVVVNSKGNLSKITIEVDSNDGAKNSATLLISIIYEVGFIRDYQAGKETSIDRQLLIGNLREKEINLK